LSLALDFAAAFGQLVERLDRAEAEIAQLKAERRVERAGNELLTASAVAKMTGRSRRALDELFRRRRRAGDQHPLERMSYEIDGSRRWKTADVEKYLLEAAGEAR
jgi:hypothetical protein